MKILMTGSSGLIGSALRARLTADGHTVVPLVRRAPNTGEVRWDPDAGVLDAPLDQIDAVIHLSGESIAAKRWTVAQKDRIVSSRVNGTRLLAGTIARLVPKPKVMISASAIGYYGDRGEEVLTEKSDCGTGFLADVCRIWEEAAKAASDAGIRVVSARFGAVLSAEGGMLGKMLPPFRMGLGGIVGSGRQWMSCITLDDLCGIVARALVDDALTGPVNVVSRDPVTNAVFTRALGKAIHRPTVAPLPAFAARVLFGQMADELLLASNRVVPAKLIDAGYVFRHSDVDAALQAVFKTG